MIVDPRGDRIRPLLRPFRDRTRKFIAESCQTTGETSLLYLVVGAAVSVFGSAPAPPDGVHADHLFTGLRIRMFHRGWHAHQHFAVVTRNHMPPHRHAWTLPSAHTSHT
jgi:hypothetical protein